jgi:hypothetical protein
MIALLSQVGAGYIPPPRGSMKTQSGFRAPVSFVRECEWRTLSMSLLSLRNLGVVAFAASTARTAVVACSNNSRRDVAK